MKKEPSGSSGVSEVDVLRVPVEVAEIVNQLMLALYEKYEPSITILLNEDMAPVTAIVVVPLSADT